MWIADGDLGVGWAKSPAVTLQSRTGGVRVCPRGQVERLAAWANTREIADHINAPAGVFAHPTRPRSTADQTAFCLAEMSLRLIRHSAIWMALSAAPLRKLSETTHITSPLSTVGSSRMRLI